MASQEPQKVIINISTVSVIKVLAVLAAAVVLYFLRDVVIMFFVALLLAAIINPLADAFAKRHIPRALAVLAGYLLVLGMLAILIIAITPPLLAEFNEFTSNFSGYWSRLLKSYVFLQTLSAEYGLLDNFRSFFETVQTGFAPAARGAFTTITGVFGGIVSFLAILVLAFYLVIEEDALKRAARSLLPDSWFPYLTQTIGRMQQKVNNWLLGQIILSLAVGTLVYVGLLILGVKFALVLALFAAFTEVVPYIGPWIGAIPAIFLGLVQSPFKALLVVGLYVIVQETERYLLIPKIMRRVVGLNPIVSILALLAGAKLGGIVGALVAIPVTTALSVLIQDLPKLSAGSKHDGA